MKLSIAIPALNEEDSIGIVIERCLAARERIVRESPITHVEITVVSDGSTDRTVERARAFGDRIRVIVHEQNQGYGAAIKTAWESTDAEVVGVLDGDGTCEPEAFAALCRELVDANADVVVGCRLNAGTHMPWIRQLGNLVFAAMLTVFSSRRVRDAASGMRVVRRASLPKLLPLPDRMQFTPAMSARAVLSDDLRLVEVDIPYDDRVGDSKLRVVRDGFRFLRVILETALLHRPSRPLAIAGVGCAVVAAALMAVPTFYYLHHRAVAEWMIYRFVVSSLLVSSACLLFACAHLTRRIVDIVLLNRTAPPVAAGRRIATVLLWSVVASLVGVGALLVAPSVVELVRTGSTYEHWSRFIAMSCLFSCALVLVVAKVVDLSLDLLAARVVYLRRHVATGTD
jgi:glycosyltransferase involved in cell wall biosynthesis